MQTIGEYLKKLLYQYDCVVVPALGAFLTHNVSASFSVATGQFLPPRRKLAFNAVLMLDDGILLSYVMLHENCSRERAGQRIQGFVDTVKQTVQQEGSYHLDGLGLFALNGDQRLQFDPELRHNFLGNAYGMQPLLVGHRQVHEALPLSLPVAETRLVSISSKNRPALDPVLSGVGVAVSTATEARVVPLPVRRYVPLRRLALLALVGSLGVLSYLTVVEPNQPLESSLNPASLFRSSLAPAIPSGTLPTVVPVPKPVLPSIPVRVAEPVVLNPTPFSAEVKPVVEAVAPKIAVKSVSAKALKTVPVPAVELAHAPFSVVAGSFANGTNAVRFKKRLLAAGYTDAYILGGRVATGRGKGLIKVVALGTQSMPEATAVVDSLFRLTGMTPWVMRTR